MRRFLAQPLAVVIVFTILVFTGCAKLSTKYGGSKGSSGRTSLNGFGALRSSYENAGFRSRDVTRLSDRVMRTDVIVWTPQVAWPLNDSVTQWFERWLLRGDRTLVYIVPDSGSEADYWRDAARLAPPQQRLEYRKQAARSVNQRMAWRLNREAVQSNGWFHAEPLAHRKEVGEIDGSWKSRFENATADSEISVEYRVGPYDKDATNQTNPSGNVITKPTGPGGASPMWTMYDSIGRSAVPIDCQEAVVTENGDTIVIEVTSKRWNGSRIIVVAGGSLLTNYAFTRPFNRDLAEQIIVASTPPRTNDLRAGFLASGWGSVQVSETKAGVPKASGMELLTVWPVSLVTMHGVMLGFVICLMLLPIFGRPRRIRRTKQSNFGDHLDAVAALMNRKGGEHYARSRISEYMKRMHGETTGPWVLPEPVVPAVPPLPPLTSARLVSRRPSSSEATTTPPPSTTTPPPSDHDRSDNDEANR